MTVHCTHGDYIDSFVSKKLHNRLGVEYIVFTLAPQREILTRICVARQPLLDEDADNFIWDDCQDSEDSIANGELIPSACNHDVHINVRRGFHLCASQLRSMVYRLNLKIALLYTGNMFYMSH